MIEMKEAVVHATQAVKVLFGGDVARVVLEEVQLSDDGDEWLVTLTLVPASDLAALLKSPLERLSPARQKLVRIRSVDGGVLGVTNP